MSVLAKVSGEWRTVDCSENSGIYVRDAGEWISLCPDEPEVLPPFELITGYTIDYVGTSASLVGGQVEFEGVTSLSLNNVFSNNYKNYLVAHNYVGSENSNIMCKLRASEKDTTGSDYTRQYLYADINFIDANRIPSQSGMVIGREGTAYGGDHINFYGPFLAKPTAVRSINVNGRDGARIETDNAHTHSLPVSYDGMTLYSVSGSITGTLSVYGVRS